MKEGLGSSQRPYRTRTYYNHALTTTFICLILLSFIYLHSVRSPRNGHLARVSNARLSARCKYLRTPAGPPPSFYKRTQSDRYVDGTRPVLLRNAKIWTSRANGTEVIHGDLLLDKGILKAEGRVPRAMLIGMPDVETVELHGAWVTPGLVDLHSHIGVAPMPRHSGTTDSNSHRMPILPFLRSIDGLNTHDASYELSISGGVTTAQVLPGSANNIGGQAFVIKLRPTAEKSSLSKVLEPPFTLNQSLQDRDFDFSVPPRWRHMKHACGENPDRLYSQTRMDAAWNFRHAYDEARKVKEAQDEFCAAVEQSRAVASTEFPESPLELESLVDVLRGRVKLSIHCYEAVDLDMIVRLSNEFKFPVASFHHAGETYLVPDLLKSAWGGAPSIALFAANARKKREAYRNSEFAPKVLADHGIPVVMKSDHPVLNSRYLLYEAQLAHFYGLDEATALMSVTSTPASAAGLGHRVGTIAKGYDADIVIWDSHPLSLGATPRQVFIDGIAQISEPHHLSKPRTSQEPPHTPDFSREAADAVKHQGTPPLEAKRVIHSGVVKFIGVRSLYVQDKGNIQTLFDYELRDERLNPSQISNWTVFVRDGALECYTPARQESACAHVTEIQPEVVIDLDGGSLSPGITSFGSPLGLVEIRLEPSTNDGQVYDPLQQQVSGLLGGADAAPVRASDGLQLGGRNTLLAYRGGVTQAITAPMGSGFLLGVSVSFSTGAKHSLERGAIIQHENALHVALNRRIGASVSTQIAALRRKLFGSSVDADGAAWARIREGEIPLVVHVDNADIMATLLKLKDEYESATGRTLLVTFSDAIEAHLLAEDIARSNISVILTARKPFPFDWDTRRILPGAPLSAETALSTLLEKNVNVAVGVVDEFDARHARFDLAWVRLCFRFEFILLVPRPVPANRTRRGARSEKSHFE
ncbi:hypothetical protein HGRIS_012604 [Hohenbuehelia grisea]|uniref:Amidohydrolase-related domain-containing protein n=1 Tax=Hohenbuehelia grisea TaxID=104357 RepID=A0ABR3ISZ6_9AGAR